MNQCLKWLRPLCLSMAALGVTMATATAATQVQDACAQATTQAAINQCANQSQKQADAALNQQYQELRDRLKDDSSARTRLTRAQRAWLVYRDAECTFAASSADGGSVAPLARAQCLSRVSQSRTAELRSYLNCPEGDVACVRGR